MPASLIRAALLAAAALAVTACMPRGPIVDTNPPPPNVGGTITGQVRAGGGEVPLSSRLVTAVNLETGLRYDASTTTTGAYTIQVPPGRYRLELTLRPNETLTARPDDLEVGESDVDADRDFVIGIKPGRSHEDHEGL